jgi:menaquinone-dependent protoporphyrinogen oxidase
MSRLLVAYASRLGSTREIAERIGSVLAVNGHVVEVRSVDEPIDLLSFDAVVLGSGVYVGHWDDGAVAFAERHAAALSRLPVWLFSSGPIGNDAGIKPTEPLDLPRLSSMIHPREHRIFWGALRRDSVDGSSLNRVERFVAKRFIPDGDWRDWPAIEAWSAVIAHEARSIPVLA